MEWEEMGERETAVEMRAWAVETAQEGGEGDARRLRQSKDGEESELVIRGEEDEGWYA